MKILKHLTLLSVLLVGCTASVRSDHGSMDGMQHGNVVQEQEDVLTVREEQSSSPVDITFSIRRGEEMLSDFGINHERDMHFIVVRDDLKYFYHLHPVRDSHNVWHTDFLPQDAGTYWMYADFVEKDGTPHTLRFERTYEGEKGEYGLERSTEQVKTVGAYTVTLDAENLDDGVRLTYKVTDAEDKPVVFENYLGAKGHAILLSPSGDFVHAHPFMDYPEYTESDAPVFMAHALPDSFYRIFTQFKIKGEVILATFDWYQ